MEWSGSENSALLEWVQMYRGSYLAGREFSGRRKEAQELEGGAEVAENWHLYSIDVEGA